MKETFTQFAILGTRKDGSQWISSTRLYQRSEAVKFKRELRGHVESRLKVVKVRVTVEVIPERKCTQKPATAAEIE